MAKELLPWNMFWIVVVSSTMGAVSSHYLSQNSLPDLGVICGVLIATGIVTLIFFCGINYLSEKLKK